MRHHHLPYNLSSSGSPNSFVKRVREVRMFSSNVPHVDDFPHRTPVHTSLHSMVVVVIAKNTERVNNLSFDSVVSFFKTNTLYLCLSLIFTIVLTKNIVPS